MILSGKVIKSLFFLTSFLYGIDVYSQRPEGNADSLVSDRIELKEVEVKADRYLYHRGRLSETTRLSVPIIQLPQNVQVIPITLIKDQLSFDLTERVVRNVSGTMREELHNGVSPDIFSRGGLINAQRNGVDLRPLVKGPLGDDVSVIQAVEFVKGPTAYMNAMSDPAGSYNVVTKKPQGSGQHSAGLATGSFGLMRAEVDMDMIGDKLGKLWYRLNLMGTQDDGFMDFDANQRVVISPSVRYNISKGTKVTLEYLYQNLTYNLLSEAQMSPYGYGTLPVNFSISEPHIRPYRAKDHSAFLNLQHRFNKKWDLQAQAAWIDNTYNGSIFWVNGVNESDPDVLERNYIYDAADFRTLSLQTSIRGSISSNVTQHEILAGVDYNSKFNRSTDTWNTATAIYPLSINNPKYAQIILNEGNGGNYDTENKIDDIDNRQILELDYVSIYASDMISLIDHKLKVHLGARFTTTWGNFDEYGDKSDAKDVNFSPRIGINYQLTTVGNLYTLYDQTFLPQGGVDAEGRALKPLEGKSIELGWKKDWDNENWTSALSAYQIRRNRMPITDPVTNSIYQAGESRSKGIEVDVRGKLFPGAHVILNYAYTDSEVSKDEWNPELIGRPTPNTITHIHNLWVRYAVPWKKAAGFQVYGGYEYQVGRTERFLSGISSDMNDLFRLDAGMGLQRDKFTVRLIINNLLNSKDYSTAWYRNGLYYWVQLPPRNFRTAVTYHF